MSLTLLEQFDRYTVVSSVSKSTVAPDREQIRRAIAIAQAVDEIDKENFGSLSVVYRRADELLGEKAAAPQLTAKVYGDVSGTYADTKGRYAAPQPPAEIVLPPLPDDGHCADVVIRKLMRDYARAAVLANREKK